ncbi:MAG: FHA domain-containing protein, partial [Planctomycetales bacterium]
MRVTLRIMLVGSEPIELERTGASLTIGRDPECDFVVPDVDAADLTSSRHAELSWNNDSLMLADLGSTNGTFVNGEVVSSRQVGPGDRIQLGRLGPEVVIVQIQATASGVGNVALPVNPAVEPGPMLLHDRRFQAVAVGLAVGLIAFSMSGSRDAVKPESENTVHLGLSWVCAGIG